MWLDRLKALGAGMLALAVMLACFATLVGWNTLFGPDCSGLFGRFGC